MEEKRRINGYLIKKIEVSRYSYWNNLALTLYDEIGEPYAIITKNLEEGLAENQAYLDTNNCSWVEKFIEENNLGKPLGKNFQSGFCTYPLYEINLDEVKKFNNQ